MSEQIDSTSDARVTNNVMRHNYRVLSDSEKAQMKSVKDYGLDFLRELHNINGSKAAFDGEWPVQPKLNSRELSLAATKIEEAVMWAVKHITG